MLSLDFLKDLGLALVPFVVLLISVYLILRFKTFGFKFFVTMSLLMVIYFVVIIYLKMNGYYII